MNNLWRAAVFEYQRNVFKKSFLITLLSIPLLIAFIVGMGLSFESGRTEKQPVGIVDQAGLFAGMAVPTRLQDIWADQYTQPVEFIFYQTEQAARFALESGDGQAYFILPENYRQTRQIEVVYTQEPGDSAWMQFYDLLRAGLLTGQATTTYQRVTSGTDFMVRSIDGRRMVPANSGPTFGLLMPLFIAFAVLATLIICSGYTATAVADEKESRTMEVLVTTISPGQLIGGKILGITLISLTLMVCWAGITALGVFIARQAGMAWFANLGLDWRVVLATLGIAIPAYVLATALMVTVGAMVTTTQEGQSLSGIVFVLHLLPMYASIAYLKDPHNSLAVILSLLPFTSLATVAMRNLFTIVPAWQVAASVVVQILCAAGGIWLAGRALRLGMLQYGQRLRFQNLLSRAARGPGGEHA
ncbi:MAG: ABC transporter permease [Anaerolineales bacterium]|nr:ABC transporter permease [Anaerolineales bacterium]